MISYHQFASFYQVFCITLIRLFAIIVLSTKHFRLMMNFKKNIILYFFVCFSFCPAALSQQRDSTFRKLTVKQLIVPAALLSGGYLLKSFSLKQEQLEWHDKYYKDFETNVDDIIQYAPYAAYVGLDLVGVKAKHSFGDRMGVLFIGAAVMSGTVFSLKHTTKVLRPDNSAQDSFPSGHTANAFFGATIVAQEYNDESIWYGIGAYSVATATGALRIMNNRHWFSDVVVGAGIGILSGKAAYVIYPWLKEKLGKKQSNNPSKIAFTPMYDGRTVGGNLVIGF